MQNHRVPTPMKVAMRALAHLGLEQIVLRRHDVLDPGTRLGLLQGE